jgi:hypothetical protein
MDMWIPMQKGSVGLDRGDHAGYHVVSTKPALDFRSDARPGAAAELAEELPVEARMDSQTLRDGKDHLPVRDGKTDLFGYVDRGQQRPFVVAGGAGASLLAGIGHEPGTMLCMVGAYNLGNEREQNLLRDPRT